MRQTAAIVMQLVLLLALEFPVAARPNNTGRKGINPDDLREWLTYFSSDELEGRAVFTEGLGLAAAYLAGQLRSWGVRPGGDNGSYYQRVRDLGVKATPHSTVTVETGGRSRTFKDGEGIRLPRNVGGKRSFSVEQVELVGYGLNASQAGHNDLSGKDLKGRVAVWLGATGPKGLDQRYRRLLGGRARNLIEVEGALASIGPPGGRGFGGRGAGTPQESSGAAPPQGPQGPAPEQPGGRGGFGFGGPRIEAADFTTVQRLDTPI